MNMESINGVPTLTDTIINTPVLNGSALSATGTNLNLTDDIDFPYILGTRMVYNRTMYTSNWTTADAVGSGTVDVWLNGWKLNIGATATSAVVKHTNSKQIFGCLGYSGAVINWDKDFVISFLCKRGTTDANLVSRFQLKNAVTEGVLGAVGIGIQVDNYAIFAEGYGSGLAKTTLSTNLADDAWTEIIIYHKAGVSDTWFVNGVSKLVDTTAANIPSGQVASSIVLSVQRVTTTATANWMIAGIQNWSAKA